MADAILVLNAGSSSLKFEVFLLGDALTRAEEGVVEELHDHPRATIRDASGAVVTQRTWDAGIDHAGALAFLLEWLDARDAGRTLAAVGHRVVHGGADLAAPVRVTPQIVTRLEALVPLAPLPRALTDAGVRRYGFHGLSYEYVTNVLPR